MKKIIDLIDKLVLPSVENHQKRYKKRKKSIQDSIIKSITFKIDDLKNIILDTHQEVGFVSVYFKDYKNLIKDLKKRKAINPIYQEDVVKKDIMLSLYKVKDSKNQVWFLVVDMTNSPNISLRDYWIA